MDWRASCAAVIPCFNEAPTIGVVVEAVRRHLSSVFVVDDGSTDNTAELADRAEASIIRHPRNLGKGAALQSGWSRARTEGFQWALTLDGDGQHSPDDIPAFFAAAERTSATLVAGNRLHEPERMPWTRRQVNRWMSRTLSKAAGQRLPDSQCGFRLIDLHALSTLHLKTQHFEIESEVLLAFARHGYRIECVPVRALYKGEQSKIHPLRDAWRWFRWWRKCAREKSD